MPLIELHFHLKGYEAMSKALDDLRREVAEANAGQAAAVTLIEGIRAQLTELASNATELSALQADVEQLASDLSASTDTLAAAVAEPGTGETPPTV